MKMKNGKIGMGAKCKSGRRKNCGLRTADRGLKKGSGEACDERSRTIANADVAAADPAVAGHSAPGKEESVWATVDLGRKKRSDSVLGRLPMEKQKAILQRCKEVSLDQVCEELRAEGIPANRQMLSKFRQWHGRRAAALAEQFGEAVSDMQEAGEFLGKPIPELDGAYFLMFANEAVCLRAFKEGDWKKLARMQQLHQNERILRLRERTVKLAEYKEEVRLISFEGEVAIEKDHAARIVRMMKRREEGRRGKGEDGGSRDFGKLSRAMEDGKECGAGSAECGMEDGEAQRHRITEDGSKTGNGAEGCGSADMEARSGGTGELAEGAVAEGEGAGNGQMGAGVCAGNRSYLERGVRSGDCGVGEEKHQGPGAEIQGSSGVSLQESGAVMNSDVAAADPADAGHSRAPIEEKKETALERGLRLGTMQQPEEVPWRELSEELSMDDMVRCSYWKGWYLEKAQEGYMLRYRGNRQVRKIVGELSWTKDQLLTLIRRIQENKVHEL